MHAAWRMNLTLKHDAPKMTDQTCAPCMFKWKTTCKTTSHCSDLLLRKIRSIVTSYREITRSSKSPSLDSIAADLFEGLMNILKDNDNEKKEGKTKMHVHVEYDSNEIAVTNSTF